MAVRQAAAAKGLPRRAAHGNDKDQEKNASESPNRRTPWENRPRFPTCSVQPPLASGMDNMQNAMSFDPAFGMCPYGMMPIPITGYPPMIPTPFGMYSHPIMSPSGMYGKGGPTAFPSIGGDASLPMSRSKSSGGAVETIRSTKSEVETPVGNPKSRSARKKKHEDYGSPRKADDVADVQEENVENLFSIEVVLNELAETARDDKGCRFLDLRLTKPGADITEKNAIVDGLVPSVVDLSTVAAGGQLVQRMLEVGGADRKRAIIGVLLPEVRKLSYDTHGCRVVQKMLEIAPREFLVQIAAELEKNVDGCIDSMHGNHVIQKCVERMPPDSVGFVIKAVENRTSYMASHMYGCRVVQRLLEHCAPNQLSTILDEILLNVSKLAQDPYGNYVIQHTLQHGRKEDKKKIIQVIKGDIVTFAKSKCSSNVVDKCFEVSTSGEHAQALEKERADLMRAVLGEVGCPNPPLQQMTDDRFGNFIVQRVIEHSRGDERDLIFQQLRGAEVQLRGSVKGKRILQTLQREFGSQQQAKAS